MKKIFIGLILGFLITSITIIYSLQVVNLETTEDGALVTIKIFNLYENYYFEKQIKNL